jgi:uncharacterized membrane protein HdeD (DUF308 family)
MQPKSLTNTTGIIFIISGLLSIAYPFYSSLGIETLFGALFLAGGIFHIFGAFEDRHGAGHIWNFCIGVLYVVTGVYLLSHPLVGLLALTLVLIALFYTQGVLMIIFGFQLRKVSPNWIWAILNGVVTMGVATVLTIGYPISSSWAFGILVGINLLMFGVSVLTVNHIKGQEK